MFYFLIGSVVYFNSLNNPFIWDDEVIIIFNPLIKQGANFLNIFKTNMVGGILSGVTFYRPIQVISYKLDYFFWGLNPLGFHITNIILFILNAILVFYFVNLILKDFWVSSLSGLFFLVHPIYPEAVTYISGRADILAGIFLLLSFISFIKYDEKKNIFWYFLSTFSFCLALLSKELAVVFPLILLIYDFCFKRDIFHSLKPFLIRYLPIFFIASIYIVLRLTVLKFGEFFLPTPESFFTRCLMSITTLNAYLGMLFVPLDMHMLRDFSRPKFEIITGLSIFSFLLLLVFICYFFRKQKVLFFFSVWFFVTLLPQSGIFPINSYISDHFIYLPAIGFFVIFSHYLLKLKEIGKHLFYIVILSILLCYLALTVAHNYDWKDTEYFFRRITKLSPRSWLAHDNLAGALVKKGRYDEALKEYKWALALDIFKTKTANIKLSIANAYILLTQADEAIKELNEIVKLDPNFSAQSIHYSLGNCYYLKKDYESAIKEFRILLKFNPNDDLARFKLIQVYLRTHKNELVFRELSETLDIDSSLLRQKTFPPLKDYGKVIQEKDNLEVTYAKLGMLFFNYNLMDLAKKSFEKAIQIAPNYADPYWHLGGIYYREGKKPEGLRLWNKAYKLDPNNPIAISWRKNKRLH